MNGLHWVIFLDLLGVFHLLYALIVIILAILAYVKYDGVPFEVLGYGYYLSLCFIHTYFWSTWSINFTYYISIFYYYLIDLFPCPIYWYHIWIYIKTSCCYRCDKWSTEIKILVKEILHEVIYFNLGNVGPNKGVFQGNHRYEWKHLNDNHPCLGKVLN